MHLNRQLCLALSSSLLAMLAACGGGQGDSTVTAESLGRPTARALAAATESPLLLPNIAVTGLTKVRETRITRTEFEYVYSVTVSNTGTPAADVTVTLDQVPAGTKIVDGKAVFGAIPKTQSQISPDTITIRQDRTVPFSITAFKWGISMAPTADPIGIDANANGIRDDIDRAIDVITAARPEIKSTVNLLAQVLGGFATGNDATSAQALAMVQSEINQVLCLAKIVGADEARTINAELNVRTFDTSARRQNRVRLLQAAGSFEHDASASGCRA